MKAITIFYSCVELARSDDAGFEGSACEFQHFCACLRPNVASSARTDPSARRTQLVAAATNCEAERPFFGPANKYAVATQIQERPRPDRLALFEMYLRT